MNQTGETTGAAVFGHLAALWAFAVAQPVFSVLSGEPAFFVSRDNGATDIVVLAVALVALVPLAISGLVLLTARLSAGAGRLALLDAVGLLVGLFTMQLAGGIGFGPAVSISVGAAAGVAGAIAYASAEPIRVFLSVLTPVPLVFLAIFLLTPPISGIVNRGDVGPVDVEISAKAPVVTIVFDEFPLASLMRPDGSIDAKRWPGFAELASAADWHRQATTVAAFTPRAVPAILSGHVAGRDDQPTAGDYPVNLFTLLAGSYELDVQEPITDLCPHALCPEAVDPLMTRLGDLARDIIPITGRTVFPEPVADDIFADVDESFGAFGQAGDGEFLVGAAAFEDRPDQLNAFVDGLSADPAALHFTHLSLPHGTWQYLPDGTLYRQGALATTNYTDHGTAWVDDAGLVLLFEERYLLQLGLVDRFVSRVIARMKELGIWRKAALVVTADHGGGFTPGDGRREATETNIGEIGFVPAFYKAPGQIRGRVLDGRFCTVDLLGEIAGSLRIQPLPETGIGCDPATIDIDDNRGDHVQVPFDVGLSQRQAAIERNNRLFGSGPLTAIYGQVMDRKLVGRRVKDLPIAAAGAEAEISSPLLTSPGVAPALIQGKLDGVEPGTPIALAVDGVIRSVGPSFDDEGGGVGFAAMLAPDSYLPRDRGSGARSHRLTLFAVRRDRAGRLPASLEPLLDKPRGIYAAPTAGD